VLCLLDRSRAIEASDRELLQRLAPERTLVLASKVDLEPAWSWREAGLSAAPIEISAAAGVGLDALRDAVRERLLGDAAGAELWITHERHAQALREVAAILDRAEGAPEDLMALELQDALRTLAALTGRGEVAEDALEHVFANFCVGK
jgi:tRNA modification GTPase